MIDYRFVEEAEAEIDSVVAWYEDKEKGLGLAFLQELHAKLLRARRVPHLGTQIAMPGSKLTVRRFFLRRFPYKIIAVVLPDMLVVVAVPRHSQHPHYWKRRLAKALP